MTMLISAFWLIWVFDRDRVHPAVVRRLSCAVEESWWSRLWGSCSCERKEPPRCIGTRLDSIHGCPCHGHSSAAGVDIKKTQAVRVRLIRDGLSWGSCVLHSNKDGIPPIKQGLAALRQRTADLAFTGHTVQGTEQAISKVRRHARLSSHGASPWRVHRGVVVLTDFQARQFLPSGHTDDFSRLVTSLERKVCAP